MISNIIIIATVIILVFAVALIVIIDIIKIIIIIILIIIITITIIIITITTIIIIMMMMMVLNSAEQHIVLGTGFMIKIYFFSGLSTLHDLMIIKIFDLGARKHSSTKRYLVHILRRVECLVADMNIV